SAVGLKPAPHARFCAGFQTPARLHEDSIHAREPQASEKRQGTKSREVEPRCLQRALWGFCRNVGGNDRGAKAECKGTGGPCPSSFQAVSSLSALAPRFSGLSRSDFVLWHRPSVLRGAARFVRWCGSRRPERPA